MRIFIFQILFNIIATWHQLVTGNKRAGMSSEHILFDSKRKIHCLTHQYDG
jgi:hypothetical protein